MSLFNYFITHAGGNWSGIKEVIKQEVNMQRLCTKKHKHSVFSHGLSVLAVDKLSFSKAKSITIVFLLS